jgi:LMBR1 domain-containing protein 1
LLQHFTGVDVQVTFIIYLAALMSFVGWFIFAIYVGIGFIALPIDCINAFRYRPRPLGIAELKSMRKALRERAKELMTVAQDMSKEHMKYSDEMHSKSERRKKGRVNGQEVNRYRVLIEMLENDLEDYQMSDPQYYSKYYNPLWAYAKLVFGVISIVLTICWIIHIIIYMLFSPSVCVLSFACICLCTALN